MSRVALGCSHGLLTFKRMLTCMCLSAPCDADGAAHQQQEGRSGSGSATPVPGSSLGEVATLSSVFDFAFTQLVKDLEAAVKTKAMEAFTKPAGGMPGSSGTVRVYTILMCACQLELDLACFARHP